MTSSVFADNGEMASLCEAFDLIQIYNDGFRATLGDEGLLDVRLRPRLRRRRLDPGRASRGP
jgi:hypothetical protein